MYYLDVQFDSIVSEIQRAFDPSSPCITLCYDQLPPSNFELTATLEDFGLPKVTYQEPYFSNEKDVPPRPREYAGREFKLQSNTVPFLPDFDPSGDGSGGLMVQRPKWNCPTTLRIWEIANPPPTRLETENWLREIDFHHPGINGFVKTRTKPAMLSQVVNLS